jgi:hypothetical protein
MDKDQFDAAEITFEERQGYLYAFVSGEKDSAAVSLESWRRVLEACYRLGYTRLMVEEDFPNQPTALEIYTVVSEVARMVTAPLRIAFVDRRSEHRELNLFGENVAVNRGVSGRIFDNTEQAESWLR